MTTTLGGSVELLDRALGYARGRLAGVDDHALDRRTPCEGWSLADLLAHLEDALDAFTEAAGGAVEVRSGAGRAGRVAGLQDKAGALLGVWGRPAPGDVVLASAATGSGGRVDLATSVLVSTAALEITVHGWDVGQATGRPASIPPALARELLSVAHTAVGPGDRGVRFAAARPMPPGAADDVRLLAFLGRG